MIVNKKKRTCRIVDFAVPADHEVKLKESKKRDKYLDLARELKKETTIEHESDDVTNCNWRARYSHQKIDLVSLFNGISTFVGYLMPKSFSKKNSNDTI